MQNTKVLTIYTNEGLWKHSGQVNTCTSKYSTLIEHFYDKTCLHSYVNCRSYKGWYLTISDINRNLCKQCRSSQVLHYLPFGFPSCTEILTSSNVNAKIQRWKSPLQKPGWNGLYLQGLNVIQMKPTFWPDCTDMWTGFGMHSSHRLKDRICYEVANIPFKCQSQHK